MIRHIDAIRMHNIQSWGEDNNILDLEYTKVNVIIARNETGKSVMLKVFRQMCFPSFFGRTGRTDLIKKGKDYGHLDILTVDNYQIGFRMFHKSQVYFLRRPDGTKGQWVQDNLPEEIREVLGWYIDEEEKILLNIIDHEIAMPLVETPASFNARVLRFVVEHQQLEESVQQYRNWLNEVDEMVKLENQRIEGLDSIIKTLPYINTNELERKKFGTELLLNAYIEIQRIAERVNRYLTEVEEIEEPAPLPPELDSEIKTIIETIDTLTVLEKSMSNINNLIKPEFNLVDENSLESIRKVDRELFSVLNSLADLNNLIIKKPVEPVIDNSIVNILELSPKLYYNAKHLEELHNIVKKKEDSLIELENIKRNISALEDELGVCPLCSKSFKEGVHEHE